MIGYRIQILTSDSQTYQEQTQNCDGTTQAVITQNYCLIPMLLFSENPFNLQQGDLIVAKVEAFNSIGYSLASEPNQDGTKV